RRLCPLAPAVFFAFMAGAPVLAPAAMAQDARSAAQPQPCTGLPNPADEIACLRRLLRTPAAAPQEPVPAPAPPSQSALGAEQVAPAAAPAPTLDRPEPSGVAAAVVEARRDARGLLVMLLDNGQIWRQDESLAIPLRLGEGARIPVEISRSGFGGYRMDFPDSGRRIVVSRVR